MIVSLIVAMDEEGGIGKDSRLPWHLRDDLRRFKRLTMGHHLIIGRKTYESIGRPLPGRTNLILTRNPHYNPEGCLVAHSLPQALDMAEARDESEAFVIGGGEVFTQALPIADRIYLTQVHARSGCDVFFPTFDDQSWIEEQRSFHPSDEENDYSSTFRFLRRPAS